MGLRSVPVTCTTSVCSSIGALVSHTCESGWSSASGGFSMSSSLSEGEFGKYQTRRSRYQFHNRHLELGLIA